MVKDPVCGMQIDEEQAAGLPVCDGKTYYFCSASCKATFDKHPSAYTAQ